MPRVTLVQHFGAREPDQPDETAQETVRLAQAAQLLDDAPAHQAKIPGIARDRHLGDLVDQPVAETGDHAFDPGLAFARGASRRDHFEALFRLAPQSLDDFRGVLQIDVDDGAPIAATIEDSGHGGGRLSEPPAEHQKADAWIARHLLADDGFGPVRRWVETEDDFICPNALEDRYRAFEKGTDVLFFLVDRHHDRNQRRGAAIRAVGQGRKGLHQHR